MPTFTKGTFMAFSPNPVDLGSLTEFDLPSREYVVTAGYISLVVAGVAVLLVLAATVVLIRGRHVGRSARFRAWVPGVMGGAVVIAILLGLLGAVLLG